MEHSKKQTKQKQIILKSLELVLQDGRFEIAGHSFRPSVDIFLPMQIITMRPHRNE